VCGPLCRPPLPPPPTGWSARGHGCAADHDQLHARRTRSFSSVICVWGLYMTGAHTPPVTASHPVDATHSLLKVLTCRRVI